MSSDNTKNDTPDAPLDSTQTGPIDTERASLQGRMLQLEEELVVERRRVADIRQAHTEAAAEFDHTRDRLRRNHKRELERARLDICRSLFEVADNFDRTLEAAQQAQDIEQLRTGMSYVRDQFFKELATFGLVRFDPTGAEFDPAEHEAIGTIAVEAEAQHNAVINVFTPGFRAGDHILRAAVVQVGKWTGPSTDDDELPQDVH